MTSYCILDARIPPSNKRPFPYYNQSEQQPGGKRRSLEEGSRPGEQDHGEEHGGFASARKSCEYTSSE